MAGTVVLTQRVLKQGVGEEVAQLLRGWAVLAAQSFMDLVDLVALAVLVIMPVIQAEVVGLAAILERAVEEEFTGGQLQRLALAVEAGELIVTAVEAAAVLGYWGKEVTVLPVERSQTPKVVAAQGGRVAAPR